MKKAVFYLFFIAQALIINAQEISTSLNYSVHASKDRSAKAPVLILLHGYGSNENDLLEMARAFDESFLTFSLRAPFKTSNGGNSWYDVEFLKDNEMKYTYEQVKTSTEKISSFIRNACKAYGADSTQVYVLGFSQGAIMAYELGVTHPQQIRGIVSLSGRMLDETRKLKADWAMVSKVKIFIAHGQSDNVIKFTDSEKAYAFFKEKKVEDLTFKNYEITHSISGAELNDLTSWLKKAISKR